MKKKVPYEYAAQLKRGELAARKGKFKAAAKWFEHASELAGQQEHLMALERSHFMHRLNGDHSPAHAETIEKTLTETASVDLNEVVVLARARGENGKWLVRLYQEVPDLTWREELLDQALDWLWASEGALAKNRLPKEATAMEQLRAQLRS